MAKPKKPTVKRTWILSPSGVVCYSDPAGDCKVLSLWETTVLTDFHDAELAKATREINAILSSLEKANTNPNHTLSFIEVRDRQFLVWTDCSGIGPNDDQDTLMKAFKLKAR